MTESNPELARFPLAGGGAVLVEVDGRAGVERAGRLPRVLLEAKTGFDGALAEVRDAAVAALAQFTTMTRPPEEIELKFGIKLDAEVGAVIARTGVQGQFEVKLKWRKDPAPLEEESVEEA
ncbi:hypothetical protein UO65_4284 [Actinokineospora spheciospongiae]|uniref:Trypsin-co-occurring domain-containing protein n=1 Tax=Actinokineospora spheciospongiae TaxID=909613 RepID=W7IVG4_9PSEU|nr:CU044_2847 family protein [Actinokineospora spheciospongiae]EWC60396.1 hypothetical protein UO65_4284 [Actinokineospora spheciospongiae]PWW66566.1 hypothetical protein DFQ13_10182 [Actinokineospora spheciospongiae]